MSDSSRVTVTAKELAGKGSVRKRASLLTNAIEDALSRGVRHYHPKTKKHLSNYLEVLECLRDEGCVESENPESRR